MIVVVVWFVVSLEELLECCVVAVVVGGVELVLSVFDEDVPYYYGVFDGDVFAVEESAIE